MKDVNILIDAFEMIKSYEHKYYSPLANRILKLYHESGQPDVGAIKMFSVLEKTETQTTDWKQKYLEAQSEITALRGTIEYWKLRLEECENFNQMQGKEGETKNENI